MIKKKDFCNKYFEKVSFFLSILYCKSLITNPKTVTSQHEYLFGEEDDVYFSNEELRTILGKLLSKLILQGLQEKQFIEIDYRGKSKFNSNKSYTYIKMHEDFFIKKDNVLNINIIENEVYRNRLCKFYSKNSITSKTNDEVLIRVNQTLTNTKLVEVDPSKAINQLITRKGREALDTILNSYSILTDKHKAIKKTLYRKQVKRQYKKFWKHYYDFMVANGFKKHNFLNDIFNNVHKQKFGNRIAHVYSNMPREFRSMLQITGRSVCELDIKSSQPFFLYLLCKWIANSSFTQKSATDITRSYLETYDKVIWDNKDFYNLMIERLGDKINRAEMKTLFFRIIFGDVRHSLKTKPRKELCEKLVGPGSFELLEHIQNKKFKSLHTKKDKNNLVCILQNTEADCMRALLSVMHSNDVDAIPIYDAVLVAEENKPVVDRLCIFFLDEYPDYRGIKFCWK